MIIFAANIILFKDVANGIFTKKIIIPLTLEIAPGLKLYINKRYFSNIPNLYGSIRLKKYLENNIDLLKDRFNIDIDQIISLNIEEGTVK